MINLSDSDLIVGSQVAFIQSGDDIRVETEFGSQTTNNGNNNGHLYNTK